MPKSAKKRKAKAADFAKAKLKLGKGKQLPSNAIDTSFKARCAIALPSQSITLDRAADAPATRRRLTFDDLIVHLKHYSPGTRKDGIAGLRELLNAHPEILEASLTALINATARAIGDEDPGVRKSLLEFFSWIFPRIPIENLIPHATTLLLFATSAQTHIFPEIRVDAIRFLNIYLEYIPAATVAGWNHSGSESGSRILEGYLGILSAGTKFGETGGPMKATSTASVVLTSASKLVVLQSLSTFLRHAVQSSSQTFQDSSSMDTWYLASWFKTREAYTAFDHLFQPRFTHTGSDPLLRKWKAEADSEFDDDFPCRYPLLGPAGSKWTLQELSQTVDSGDDAVNDDNSLFIAHLARTLYSTLVSTFLDCAPAVFSPNGNVDETQAKLIVAVAEITVHLYGAILQNSSKTRDSERHTRASEDLKSILGYMSPYFPFRLEGSRNIQVEHMFQALNLMFCKLTSLVILTAEGASPSRDKRPAHGQGDSKGSLQMHTERVSRYVIKLLKGESLSTSQLGRPLTPATYTALLPTIWSLINNADPRLRDVSSDILLATIEHGSKVPSKSALKSITIEFIARVTLLDMEPQFLGHLNIDANAAQQIAGWVNHLPKCLWELGSTNLSLTEIILRFLIAACRCRSPLADLQTLGLLRSQMIPFFSIMHPTRGQIPGPYSKLPPVSPLRRLVLCLVALIRDDSTLSSAVSFAVLGTEDELYWHNVSNSS
ncbi:hypothetical protein GGX14DRAFT_452486 [Mycena pura]|uniref:Pre-rRNA-processing protein n=1 Tax=Mycena pura TaxID=153505 RepID=A0AAD6VH35_9AGAR|nr:hypothetical protein GGX14DRAFT_452486 [Mycena pura]